MLEVSLEHTILLIVPMLVHDRPAEKRRGVAQVAEVAGDEGLAHSVTHYAFLVRSMCRSLT